MLLIDILGMAAFRKNFDMGLVKFLLPFGLLGTLVGKLLFSIMPADIVAGIVGGFTLLFLAQRLAFLPKPDSPPPPSWLGAVLAVTSGFTSFISHAAGRRSALT